MYSPCYIYLSPNGGIGPQPANSKSFVSLTQLETFKSHPKTATCNKTSPQGLIQSKKGCRFVPWCLKDNFPPKSSRPVSSTLREFPVPTNKQQSHSRLPNGNWWCGNTPRCLATALQVNSMWQKEKSNTPGLNQDER